MASTKPNKSHAHAHVVADVFVVALVFASIELARATTARRIVVAKETVHSPRPENGSPNN